MDRNKIIRCVDISKEDAAFLLEEQEPVKHGRWIFEEHPDSYYYHWECSNCKAWFSDNARFGYNYCPNCGAKMDKEGGNDKP